MRCRRGVESHRSRCRRHEDTARVVHPHDTLGDGKDRLVQGDLDDRVGGHDLAHGVGGLAACLVGQQQAVRERTRRHGDREEDVGDAGFGRVEGVVAVGERDAVRAAVVRGCRRRCAGIAVERVRRPVVRVAGRRDGAEVLSTGIECRVPGIEDRQRQVVGDAEVVCAARLEALREPVGDGFSRGDVDRLARIGHQIAVDRVDGLRQNAAIDRDGGARAGIEGRSQRSVADRVVGRAEVARVQNGPGGSRQVVERVAFDDLSGDGPPWRGHGFGQIGPLHDRMEDDRCRRLAGVVGRTVGRGTAGDRNDAAADHRIIPKALRELVGDSERDGRLAARRVRGVRERVVVRTHAHRRRIHSLAGH